MKKKPVPKKRISLKTMVIVHGKSELQLCQSIRSNLRIKKEIVSRDNGRHSIQITSVMNILNGSPFHSIKKFLKEYGDIECEGGRPVNFKLFIIMDVDDCTEEQCERFKNKEMFLEHWLHEYIIPVHNHKNLEDTMDEAGIEVNRKKDYIMIFPTNHGDLNMEMAEAFLNKLKCCKPETTNLHEYIAHCLNIAKEQRNTYYSKTKAMPTNYGAWL